jgi:hypothetical protein
VVVLPGGVDATAQMGAAIHYEQPRLIDWSASATELADSAAYVNLVGKKAGSVALVGSIAKRASGSAAADAWVDSNGDAMLVIQRQILHRSTYAVATGVNLAVDTNADGVADGLVKSTAGTVTGDVYTYSIVSSRQRRSAAYAASGATGNDRLGDTFTAVAGRRYMALFKIINATTSPLAVMNTISDITGTAVAQAAVALAADGSGWIYYDATADASASKYARVYTNRVNGSTVAYDIDKAEVIDITALLVDAPNLAGLSTAEMAAFVTALAA